MAPLWRCTILSTAYLKKHLIFRSQVAAIQVRHLNLLEYQSKVLLGSNGITVQEFRIVENVKDSENLVKEFKADEYVIKAQVLAGGRGLGQFDNGFQGGVHLTKDPEQVLPIVEKMVGHRLVTKQTPSEGILVKKVMVAESVEIIKERYLCVLMDSAHHGPVIVASPAGGTDIEEVSENSPELIKTVPIDIVEGLTDSKVNEVAEFLDFKEELKPKAITEIQNIYKLFNAVDALQIEINPLAETSANSIVAVDAKIQFDDNAQFRQKEIFDLEDLTEIDSREAEAAKYNLNYIGMTGSIGCLVNGAGLAMATMDLINLHGAEPANFLDVGGGVQEEQVYQAFSILTKDPNVKCILVNVFGGIVNCSTIANGIVSASRNINLNIPIVVRLEGTNVEEGKKILADSGLPIQSATDLDDAALKAVKSLPSKF